MVRRLLLLVVLFSLSTQLFAQQKDSTYNAEMKLPGIKMITVLGKYKVWTRKVGHGDIKVLLLHGGPANTHEYLETLADTLAKHGIEVYLYDQLGSYFSDQPPVVKGDTLWKMATRVQEVEDVRKGLGLDRFYLYGHSFGALLGLAYASKYPSHLKGLIYSSMNTDFNTFQVRYGPFVDRYVDSLMRMDTAGKKIMAKKDQHLAYDTAAYQKMNGAYFRKTFFVRSAIYPASLRTMRAHLNFQVTGEVSSSMFQSPEYRVNLADIKLPVLFIAGDYDFTTSPLDMENQHRKVVNSRLYIVRDSGHMSMLDQAADYDAQIMKFLTDVETKKYKP